MACGQPKPAEAGKDYVPVSGSITFEAGQTESSLKVQLLPNEERKEWRWFFVRLSNPVGAVLKQKTAVGWIPPNEDTGKILSKPTQVKIDLISEGFVS